MRPPRIVLATVAGLMLAALPAPAFAGSWTAARAATAAGTSSPPSVAVGPRGRLAIGWVRTIGGSHRAELRRGTLHGWLRSGALIMDQSAGNVDSVALGYTADGIVAAAWRRLADRAQRLRVATVTTGGSLSGPVDLTPAGSESAYDPTFVTAPDGGLRLMWTRRTTSAARLVTGNTFGAQVALPAPGIGADPAVAVDGDGTTVVAWVQNGQAFAAQAPAGGPFGAAVRVSGAGVARAPQLAVTDDGDVVAAWLSSTGQGNEIDMAVRPHGGAFGPAVQVVPPSERAFQPRLAATGAGEVLLAWIATNAANGFAGGRGPVRLQRLGGDERPVGPPITLSPAGVRASAPAIAHDGAGSALAAWTDSASDHGTVQARRIAPGAIVGPVRTLFRGGAGTTTPVLAATGGQGVAAWLSGSDVRYSVYR
jgi:hypothetical protein